mmetsp:Transcript_87513/g.192232  ORF Transcript_87513/g.192232 Transcript_87513/m.192232 type:complete len:686 (-) Transcript_87513:45-2102(-)
MGDNNAPGQGGRKGDPNRALSMSFIKYGLFEDLAIKDDENVYQIEERIREKGENTECPRDGRPGAAYVDVAADKYAGPANLMLSYGWGYKLSAIKSALERYCNLNKWPLETRRVWICCFCVNQHRVQEARANKEVIEFDQFRNIFKERVRSAGCVVGLLSPWDDPLYVKRVWCLFEAWESTRIEGKIQLDFVLPETDAQDYLRRLATDGLKTVNEVLSKIDVQEADASVKADKDQILKLISDESDSSTSSGADKLNKVIKSRLQKWFTDTAAEKLMHDKETFEPKLGIQVADLYTRLGLNHECKILVRSMIDWCSHRSGKEDLKAKSLLHLRLARNCGNAGDQNGSLEELGKAKALAIQARKDPNNEEEDEAEILKTYGACYRKLGRLKESFEFYKGALGILQKNADQKKQALPKAAGWILLNMGLVRTLLEDANIDVEDAESAQVYYDRAGEVYEESKSTSDMEYAWLQRNRGDCYMKAGKFQAAKSDFDGAQEIHKKMCMEHVENHGELMKSVGNLCFRSKTKDDQDAKIREATCYYEQAREILRRSLSHKEAMVDSLLNLSTMYSMRGDIVSCQAMFSQAMAVDAKIVSDCLSRMTTLERKDDPFERIKRALGQYGFLTRNADGVELVRWKVLKRIMLELKINFDANEHQLLKVLEEEGILSREGPGEEAIINFDKFADYLR